MINIIFIREPRTSRIRCVRHFCNEYLIDGLIDISYPFICHPSLVIYHHSSLIPNLPHLYYNIGPVIIIIIMSQAVLERDLALRSALACVTGTGEVAAILDKLKAAYLTRLDLTQNIIDSYTS